MEIPFIKAHKIPYPDDFGQPKLGFIKTRNQSKNR